MKQSISTSTVETSGKRSGGFTLTELLVIIAVAGILSLLLVSARAGGKDHTTFAVCANNVRQLALALQIYADEYQGKLPTLSGGGASYPWDLPDSVAQVMLTAGCQKKTFYCPGTQPRFTDWQNFLEPSGTGGNLWDFGGTNSGLHITGYSFAFSGPASKLLPINQNQTILPERIPQGANSILVSPVERVLIADAILSINAVLPATPADNFTSIAGGFTQNGSTYPHTSPHIVGQMPVGNNLAFKDGHVSWRKFNAANANANNNDTKVRTTSAPYFWW